MRLTLIVVSIASLMSGCALRPRYADFVTPKTAGKEVTFLVIDADTNKPVPNARVEVSELRSRIQVTTGPDGSFKLPVERKYLEENPVFLVTLPRGVVTYRVTLAPPPPPPPPAAVEPVVAPPEAPASEPVPGSVLDAGMPASNG